MYMYVYLYCNVYVCIFILKCICMYIYFLSNDNPRNAHIYKIKGANLFDMTKRDSEN